MSCLLIVDDGMKNPKKKTPEIHDVILGGIIGKIPIEIFKYICRWISEEIPEKTTAGVSARIAGEEILRNISGAITEGMPEKKIRNVIETPKYSSGGSPGGTPAEIPERIEAVSPRWISSNFWKYA